MMEAAAGTAIRRLRPLKAKNAEKIDEDGLVYN
jgi:hypothetical protein